MTIATQLEPGMKLGHYSVRRILPLDNVQGRFIELEHERLGSRHIHIECQDDNNLFWVMFPTIPEDSTGVAHILEHVVLAGSERFGVRDPFFAMLPRSLSTYMNASTGSDSTTYPFSTRNRKDYFNLLSVYLDACFFPRIELLKFLQEGWRFEFEKLDDPTSPLKYKGVVFNEMKGAMASVPSILFRAVGRALYPNLTYRFNSGGDPLEIPELTHEQLCAFHAAHYHPSNAHFLTYGNLELEETLNAIETQVMTRFERLELNVRVPDQPTFDAPVRLEVAYPLSRSESPEKQGQVVVAWKTALTIDSFEKLALSVLSRTLLANAASPLRKALVDSGLGSALSDMLGLVDAYREMAFTAGLKGVRLEDAEKVEGVILDTLGRLVQDGIPDDLVDAAIHRLEIETREVSNAGAPYGLKLAYALKGAYQHGGDPYRALQFDADLEQLRQARASGQFMEHLIEKYLLHNPHRAMVILKPDQDMTERAEAAEQARLETIKAGLSASEIDRIVQQAQALELDQNTPQDLNVLPTLELTDVPMAFEDVPFELKTIQDATVGLFPQPTNGLIYLDLQMDFSGLPDNLKNILPVFAFVAPKMGSAQRNYLEMAAQIERFTGGIGMGAGVQTAPDDQTRFTQVFTVSGKALARNLEPFLRILGNLTSQLRFDRTHLRNLLGQYRASLESRVVSAGHDFAQSLAEAQLSAAGALQERLKGVTQVRLAKQLAGLDDSGLEGVITNLEAIRDHLFGRVGLRVCVTAEESQLERVSQHLETMLHTWPAFTRANNTDTSITLNRKPQARTTAVPVAYDAWVVPTVPYTHPDAGALLVLSKYLRSKYTHPEVREKGGAYGGYAIAEPESGVFSLLSYRDPHIKRTFDVFQNAQAFVQQTTISPEELKEAILSACKSVDPLLSPDSKGRVRFFGDQAGFTLALRKAFKRQLLTVTADDLRRVARTYLSQEPARAVISNEDKVRQADTAMGNVFEVAAL
jgi:Zn-dependent M16 (insulinase) family peptidase